MANISLRLGKLTYDTLAGFAQTIHDGFVLLVALFATPNPLMTTFQDDIDALKAAIAKWGTKPTRGSSADLQAVKDAAAVVRLDLRMLAAYAMNTVPLDPSKWIDLGFSLRQPHGKPAKLQIVQNFRHFIARDVAPPAIKLKWKRPLFAQPHDVKIYIVQRSNTSVYPEVDGGRGIINIIGFVTKTEFVDENPYVGENFYWVTPVNGAGLGTTSEAVRVVSTKVKPA
jgi:hypothetical protein